MSRSTHPYGDAAARQAVFTTRRTQQLQERVTHSRTDSFQRFSAFALLLLGVWLVVAPWVLAYPETSTERAVEWRSTGGAVLVILCAVRMLVAAGRARVACALAAFVGGLLVLSGVFLPHTGVASVVNECGTGALVLFFGALALL